MYCMNEFGMSIFSNQQKQKGYEIADKIQSTYHFTIPYITGICQLNSK